MTIDSLFGNEKGVNQHHSNVRYGLEKVEVIYHHDFRNEFSSLHSCTALESTEVKRYGVSFIALLSDTEYKKMIDSIDNLPLPTELFPRKINF